MYNNSLYFITDIEMSRGDIGTSRVASRPNIDSIRDIENQIGELNGLTNIIFQNIQRRDLSKEEKERNLLNLFEQALEIPEPNYVEHPDAAFRIATEKTKLMNKIEEELKRTIPAGSSSAKMKDRNYSEEQLQMMKIAIEEVTMFGEMKDTTYNNLSHEQQQVIDEFILQIVVPKLYEIMEEYLKREGKPDVEIQRLINEKERDEVPAFVELCKLALARIVGKEQFGLFEQAMSTDDGRLAIDLLANTLVISLILDTRSIDDSFLIFAQSYTMKDIAKDTAKVVAAYTALTAAPVASVATSAVGMAGSALTVASSTLGMSMTTLPFFITTVYSLWCYLRDEMGLEIFPVNDAQNDIMFKVLFDRLARQSRVNEYQEFVGEAPEPIVNIPDAFTSFVLINHIKYKLKKIMCGQLNTFRTVYQSVSQLPAKLCEMATTATESVKGFLHKVANKKAADIKSKPNETMMMKCRDVMLEFLDKPDYVTLRQNSVVKYWLDRLGLFDERVLTEQKVRLHERQDFLGEGPTAYQEISDTQSAKAGSVSPPRYDDPVPGIAMAEREVRDEQGQILDYDVTNAALPGSGEELMRMKKMAQNPSERPSNISDSKKRKGDPDRGGMKTKRRNAYSSKRRQSNKNRRQSRRKVRRSSSRNGFR